MMWRYLNHQVEYNFKNNEENLDSPLFYGEGVASPS